MSCLRHANRCYPIFVSVFKTHSAYDQFKYISKSIAQQSISIHCTFTNKKYTIETAYVIAASKASSRCTQQQNLRVLIFMASSRSSQKQNTVIMNYIFNLNNLYIFASSTRTHAHSAKTISSVYS